MEELDFIILIFSSGFVGALAGGGIALWSQHLNRKWKKEDDLISLKIKLYSEIIGVGARYVGEEAFEKINDDVAKAFLVCEQDLYEKLIKYMSTLEKLNNEIKGKSQIERNEIVKNNYTFNIISLHEEMLKIMQKEIGIS